MGDTDDLTVAVTGPTGDIGRALLRRLDADSDVDRVIGMARRPFDPSEAGLEKVEYRQGDICDKSSVDSLVEDADVVVHLAFLIFGSVDETRVVNLEGCRNVFEASFDAAVERLVYTSSVAAYGFHDDNPELLTEDVHPRGTEEHYYSAQKAELEGRLKEMSTGSDTDVFVFRPCIVAGPSALSLIEKIPYVQIGERLPKTAKRVVQRLPLLRPVIPDPGVPFQLVHEYDVAEALTLAILGKGEPGVYNLAADGEITLSDMAHALGWYALPIPEVAVDATLKVISALPLLPAQAGWINAVRVPVLMDCTKAREKLGWEPEFDALDTLAETIRSARDEGLLARRTSDQTNEAPA
ncbi:MAG: NAD-dependent epimerase/dehydratase family protein [Actinomycetota bacterium]|nr:NAD-dependent epimerase/dehydratase family protein [Actinomycetota bacterium]